MRLKLRVLCAITDSLLGVDEYALHILVINEFKLDGAITDSLLGVDGYALHILVINETKFDSAIIDSLLGVNGYALHRRDRDRHGGGVAVYVRESLKHHRWRDIPEGGLEFIGIEVKPTKALPFLVVTWYRPPSDPIESFTRLEGILEFFDRESKETILLGDTNCDMYLLENSPENSTNNVNAAVHMASIYDKLSDPSHGIKAYWSVLNRLINKRNP